MNPILLVCSVGGAPEPVAASILACQPARVIFVCSTDSRRSVNAEAAGGSPGGVLTIVADRGIPYDEGRTEFVMLADAQDLEGCVAQIHRLVTPEVQRWIRRGGEHRVVVDFTGGTKCMTLALGLMTRSWSCQLQYIGGTERTKDGLGIVVSGREQIVHFQNPWNSLGYQLWEDARVIFNHGGYGAAAAMAAERRNRIAAGPLKEAAAVLTDLLEGYAHWDRFEYSRATRAFRRFETRRNLLAPLVPQDEIERLGEASRAAERATREAAESQGATRVFVIDLLANARRRIGERRYDDAVARLYRAVEATAQWRLAAFHNISSTARVAATALPVELRREWEGRVEDGTVRLGLQDAYRLLEALGDPLGRKFRESGLGIGDEAARSLLTSRNTSCLAHGFDPASETVAFGLFAAALRLVEAQESDLPIFPVLGWEDARG